MRLIAIWICSLLFIQGISGQLSVSGSFEKDTVLIGDPIKYTVSIKTTPQLNIISISDNALDSIISGVQTQMLAQADTTKIPDPVISDYEFTSLGRWSDNDGNGLFDQSGLSFDTTIVGRERLLENTFELVFWDPGPQGLAHPQINYRFADSTYHHPFSGVSQVFVAPPFDLAELESDSITVAGLKPIIKEGKNITDYYHLMVIAAAILGLLLIWFLWTKTRNRKTEVVQEEEIIKPAHVIALNKLNGLKEEELWQKGQIKEYQSKLTFAIREYLENRYDIQALESTTDEISRELKKQDFGGDDEMALKEILQVADLVKFAKGTPDVSVHERFLDKAVNFVNKTKVQLTLEQELRLDRDELKKQQQVSREQEAKFPLQNQEYIQLDNTTENATPTPRIVTHSQDTDSLDSGIISNNSPTLSLATKFSRFLAYIVDNVIVSFLMLGPVGILLSLGIDPTDTTEGPIETSDVILTAVIVIVSYLLPLIYYVISEGKYGKTIGKKLLKIKVVKTDGTKIGILRALGRNLLKGVSAAFLLLPFLMIFFTKKRQTMHDKLCNTIIVNDV